MQTPFNFTCKYCLQRATITEEDFVSEEIDTVKNFENYSYSLELIKCPNPDCKRVHSNLHIDKKVFVSGHKQFGIITNASGKEIIKESIQILPESSSISLPQYLPKDIKRDINEANLIREKSLRASASLLRRALQSMIRDFWKDEITPNEINNEITQLKDKITDTQLYNALHSLKNISSFAAHPEKDITSIIEITKSELDEMFKVIFILIKEWYINKKEKEESLKALNKIATSKKQQSRK